MPRQKVKGLDHAISQSNTEVLRQKFTQSAVYVHDLEQKLAKARGLQEMIRQPPKPLDSASLRAMLPGFIKAIVWALGGVPSILVPEWDLLKNEAKPALAEMGRCFLVLKRFVALPEETWLTQPTAKRAELLNAALDAYLGILQDYLVLNRDLRDRLTWELNNRPMHTRESSRARDQAQRDKRIKELARENRVATAAAHFALAKVDMQMKQIIARGNTKLTTKETIRNVHRPRRRKGGKKGKEITASRRNLQDTR